MSARVGLLVPWLLILPILTIAASAQEKRDQRIYSNVQYIEEGAGDLVGTELKLTLGGSEVNGNLKIYEGACAAPIAVRGTLAHGQLHITGMDGAMGRSRFPEALVKTFFKESCGSKKGQAPRSFVSRESGSHTARTSSALPPL